MTQTAVSQVPAVAREGMRADSGFGDVLSRIAEVDIPAGRVVTLGTDIGEAKLPVATGNITDGSQLGISLFDASREPHTTTAEYDATDMIPVLRKGRVWMVAEDAVAEGNSVFVRFTAGGAEELGRVRSDADTADAVALPGAIFRSTTTGADELVLVEVNLP